ncbi:3-oxoacyl-[acyl-carrier-protein] synthase 1 [Microbulbifer aggregans]|uniref:3-oxoacyl-[acyl-carrier-protein] synthase 1 n=1 Tax=Microbulbifer aggregans TaxID=1769779 RepID=A0A1C9W6T2_9GAMM|nr:beta-ketoacyl-ACP synthase I [Microbulbifer aggregans]AOS96863.1 3-oxoacyl-[acyl-carrier-protein] synthase 1 [Microbulbifer aggregans]
MRRVAITGMGITSCIGTNLEAVTASLQAGRSGIRFQDEYRELGLRSQVAGPVDIDFKDHIDRKHLRFMGDSAAYAYIAMQEAIRTSGLEESDISNPRTGLVMGSGGTSTAAIIDAAQTLKEKGVRRVGAFRVPQVMGSTVSACLATPFKIKGVNYSISSACATSAHCIGNGAELIQMGKQDIVFAGGGEELAWSLTHLFDAMGALSSKYNDTPERASRPYDADRDGFVIAGGGGCLVLEEMEHAKARGATIYAELTGYGATSDGYDMVAPSGEGAVRCMQQALAGMDGKGLEGGVDYVNTHGTSTPVGDVAELRALREVFGDNVPPFASTKSLTGHSLGAAGVQEAIYSLLMMQNDFIAASANVENRDAEAEGMDLVTEKRDAKIQRALSNSFGFGGTNACLVFDKV